MNPVKFALHQSAIAAAAKKHNIAPSAVEDVARATQTRVFVSDSGVLTYPGFTDLDDMLAESKKQDVIRAHNYIDPANAAPVKSGLTQSQFEAMTPSQKLRHGTLEQAIARGDIRRP